MISFGVVVLANVLDRPRNEAVIAGQATQITCSYGTENRVYWLHTLPNDKANEKLLYGREIALDSFSNTNATGRVRGQSLNINPVKVENSGIFKCVSSGMELLAQLTVLGGFTSYIQLIYCCYSGFFRFIHYPEKLTNNIFDRNKL